MHTGGVTSVDRNQRLEQFFYWILVRRKAVQPNEHHAITVLLVARLARVLVFDRFDVFLGEVPVSRQTLPVVNFQIVARHTPQQFSHRLAERVALDHAVTAAVARDRAVGVG